MNDAVAAKPRKPRAPRKAVEMHRTALSRGDGADRIDDPLIRTELKKAAVWIGMATLVVALIWLAQPYC